MAEWWSERQRIVQTNLRLTDADMDCREVARDARRFGATAIFFNVGGIWAWYPTELPLQAVNPYMKRDVLGDMLEACRAEDLHFVGRFDLSKGTQVAFDAHPEWFCVTSDGRPFEYNGTYQASITGGWYHEQGPALMTEVLRRYDIQACFFNMFGYQRFTYSHKDMGFSHDPSAVHAFAEFSGGKPIPDENDLSSPALREYLRFQDHTSGIVSRKIYDAVKAANPRVGVANLAGYRDWIRLETNRSVSRPQPEWPYQTGESARFAQSVARGRAPYTIGVTHFYDFPWRYTAESAPFQANRMAQAVANGAEPHYYFMGPVASQRDTKPMEAVKRVFTLHAEHQALYDGLASASRIALYASVATDRFGLTVNARDVHGAKSAASRGAYRALLESGLAFDLVSDRTANDPDFADTLRRYDVVILPDVTCMSDVEGAALDAYVAAGGNLIVTAETGSRDGYGEPRAANALRCLPIARVKGVRRDMFASYLVNTDGKLSFPGTSIVMLDDVYVQVEPAAGTEIMMQVQYPQEFGPPELSFPTEPLSTDPGVILGPHGRGQVAFVPFAPDRLFFRHSFVEHRELLAQLVGRFSRPVARLEKASRVELTVRRHIGDGRIVVHLINYSGQSNDSFEEAVIQHGLVLLVQGARPGAGRALVSGRTVQVGPPGIDGYARVELPPVAEWEAVVLDA